MQPFITKSKSYSYENIQIVDARTIIVSLRIADKLTMA